MKVGKRAGDRLCPGFQDGLKAAFLLEEPGHLEERVGIGESMTAKDGSSLWTLEEISRLISERGNASETLTNVVNLIQRRFETDVCSVYLLEPDRANLVL